VPGKRSSTALAVQKRAQGKIVVVRGEHVILDSDLAAFYGVSTGRLNEQATRNEARFPEDFRFQLTRDEANALLSQNAITKGRGGRTTPPWVYTEPGALQAAGVLRSAKADEVSVAISRAFVTMRDRLTDLAELARALPEIRKRLEELEGDVEMLAGDAADQHAETKKLTDSLKSLKDVVKEMKRAERSLPPAM
jgi:hypothetical protein